tara:strand:+ start:539 stop:649 length:111 start_codon:yes stop_codon:yes gene_type:complete
MEIVISIFVGILIGIWLAYRWAKYYIKKHKETYGKK